MRLREKVLRTKDLCPLRPVKPTRTRGKVALGPASETRLHLFHSSLPHRDDETYRSVSRNTRNLCQKCPKLRDKPAKRLVKSVPLWPKDRITAASALESWAAWAPESARDPGRAALPASAPAPARGPAPELSRARGWSLGWTLVGVIPRMSDTHPRQKQKPGWVGEGRLLPDRLPRSLAGYRHPNGG
jgi:hypothetical protein